MTLGAPTLVLAAAVLAAVAVIIRFELYCLRDLAEADEVQYLSKPAWALVCVLCIPIGGMLYLLYGRVR